MTAELTARAAAWDVLGTRLDGVTGSIDAMHEADLAGWNVRKAPLTFASLTDGKQTVGDVPDRFATIRNNPATGGVDYLGVVGSHYTPIQNEAHAELLDAVVDVADAKWEAAGASAGGKRVFMTMRLPDTVQIGGKDAVDLYLVALNSHDGNSSFRFMVTPVRVTCTNMQAAALKKAAATFSIRHTANAGREIQEAREALGLTYKYVEAFEAEAEAMLAKRYTNKQFDAYAAQLFNIVDEGKASKRAIDNRDGLVSLYRDSETLTGIRGTRWGAYQAVTEYVDHVAPAGLSPKIDQRYARAQRSFDGKGEKLKRAAFALLG